MATTIKPHIMNPLDELFQTEQPTTEVIQYEQVPEGVLVEQPPATDQKDAEDVEIDRKIDQVYDEAIATFQTQMAYTEVIEPRYAARNAEVAASYLNIALNAAAARARVKGDRKRNGGFVPYGVKNPNAPVTASREDIMRMLTVDAETKAVK